MAMQASVSRLLLRNVPLFSMLSEDQLGALTEVVSRRNFPRGATIVVAGDVTDALYVVISGRVKVVIGDAERGEVILRILGPREYFGEMAPIEGASRSASVVTLQACDLLVLSKDNFRKSLAENFDMTMEVMRCLIRRLREADRKIQSLALMDVYGRVARQLLEMSETVDGRRVVTPKITKQEVARMIGASREMVSRVWKQLQEGGFIELRGDSIVLHDEVVSID